MLPIGQVVGAATTFVWLGMLLAISFLETPLKFRAPGMTLPLGLGIGRLVFAALNRVEILLVTLVIAAMFAAPPGHLSWLLLVLTGSILVTQTGFLRPRLNRRTRQIIAGHTPPPSRLHLAYIGLECLKVAALFTLGTFLMTGP